MNLFKFRDQYNRKFVDKIHIHNRRIYYTDSSNVPDYYMLQNDDSQSFFPFIWEGDLVIKIDSLDFYKSKTINSSINDELLKSDSLIRANWTKRVVWKQYVDSIRLKPLQSLGNNYSDENVESRLMNESYNQYLDLMLKFICDNPSSKISLHYLRFNHLLLPQKKVDSIKVNVIPSYMKLHPWYIDMGSSDNVWTLEVGALIPHFKAVDISGNTIDSRDLLGEFYLLDFWGTWCTPCIEVIPVLREFYLNTKGGFKLISVACERDGDKDRLGNFIVKNGMVWPQIFESKSSNDLSKALGIYTFPTLILIDANGFVVNMAFSKDATVKLLKKAQSIIK